MLRACPAEMAAALLSLETDPLHWPALSDNLRGVRAVHWRAKKVEYRAAFVLLEQERVCIIYLIGTRENFYKAADARLDAVKKALAEGRLRFAPDEDDEAGPLRHEAAPAPPEH